MKYSSHKYTFFIDTNRINARKKCEHMNELEQLASDGKCSLIMPKCAWDESEAGPNIERKSKTWGYFHIGLDKNTSQRHWYREIESVVFPNGANTQNQINDIWILVTAREMGYPLVTNDGNSESQPGGILGHANLLKQLGVIVLRDEQAVRVVKKKLILDNLYS